MTDKITVNPFKKVKNVDTILGLKAKEIELKEHKKAMYDEAYKARDKANKFLKQEQASLKEASRTEKALEIIFDIQKRLDN